MPQNFYLPFPLIMSLLENGFYSVRVQHKKQSVVRSRKQRSIGERREGVRVTTMQGSEGQLFQIEAEPEGKAKLDG